MPQRNYPDWIQTFVEWSSYGEAPLKMLFWTGVSTLAGALRRRVWIDQKFFQWVPNFYIVMVAPPGIVSKSTTANIGMNLLRDVTGINFGPDIITWQSLLDEMERVSEGVIDPSDPMISHMMSALTVSSDEFGTFLNPDNSEMIDVLVSLWDGKRGAIRKLTKTQGGNTIENPWINIIGCTTPDWIAGRFPQYLIGGGFTSRCVFLYADRKRQHVAYVDRAVPPGFDDMRKRLVEDLEQISQLFGQYELAPDARLWGEEWYEKHWAQPIQPLNTDQFQGYLARKQTHIHKLAMVLSAAKSNELVISKQVLVTAAKMVSAVEEDMPKVFARIGQNDLTRGAAGIAETVRKAKKISKGELYSAHFFRTLSYQDFEKAFESAKQAGHIRVAVDGMQLMVFATGD